MSFLKFIVVFMGILIIAGFSVVVVTIYNRSQLSIQDKMDSKISLPENYKIVETFGMDKKIGFRFVHLSNGNKLLRIYNLKDGSLANEIILE